MSDYQRDAYVDELPFRMPSGDSHAVIVDVLNGEEVVHQIICFAMGAYNAGEMAKVLNQWRDQTRFTQ